MAGSVTGRRGRLAVALIVLGSLLTPVAIASTWTRTVLNDTEAVVTRLAPLAGDPLVQEYLTAQVTTAIQQRLDVSSMVDPVFDGLTDLLAERPVARRALAGLRQLAADGIQAVVESGVAEIVASDRFAGAWREVVRISHRQTILALSGDPEALLAIDSEGVVLRLAPLVELARSGLLTRGVLFADRIPVTDRTIELASGESLGQVQAGYRGLVTAGAWLGPLVVVLLVSAVLVAKDRVRAAVRAAAGLGGGALAVLAGSRVALSMLVRDVPDTGLPEELTRLLYDTLTSGLTDLALAALLLAVTAGALAWVFGWFVRPTQSTG